MTNKTPRLCCAHDDRRDAVRRMQGRNGLDYVEVGEDVVTLSAYFLGRLPDEFAGIDPSDARFLRLEGGRRIRDLRIVHIEGVTSADPEKDDVLIVRVNKPGDFSTYTLRLVGVEGIDPRYDRAEFAFRIDCPSDLDCVPDCDCEPPEFPEPDINYLARDYASFKQLILDRLAVIMPEWRERHAPDIGVMLVEVLAYVADYLSYYQDAVATEAYLGTARQRISVRRHARLVDYVLHEGCNARAWVFVQVSSDIKLDPASTAFLAIGGRSEGTAQNVLTFDEVERLPVEAYDVFEPLVVDRTTAISLHAAHNEIRVYAWGQRECCLEIGSTSATFIDIWTGPGAGDRALQLAAGDVLMFEEVIGPHTGLPADRDPARRHAVRITAVTRGEDPVVRDAAGRPTPYVEVEWHGRDALPFTLCISVIGPAPRCAYIENVTVARGNIVLVDHGATVTEPELGEVPVVSTDAECSCAGHAGEIQIVAGRFEPGLERTPLTFAEPLAHRAVHGHAAPAVDALTQDPWRAVPQLWVTSSAPNLAWETKPDLLASGPDDRHVVVEIDNERMANLRFGDGELGSKPAPETAFAARYRVGSGLRGNVGAEAISRLVQKDRLSGQSVVVRNLLPATGGAEPEPIAEAKLFAPHTFRKRLARAITAADYATLAERHRDVQRASARLIWTGSWYEADVAIDPIGREQSSTRFLESIRRELEDVRRVGHDVHVLAAVYLPILLALEVCALPGYDPGHVKAALLRVFGRRKRPGGALGFFHPDNLTFGGSIFLSRIVAEAQAVAGVECATVTRLERLFDGPNGELASGVLPLRTWEIAQLDNDPSRPEHGRLEIHVRPVPR